MRFVVATLAFSAVVTSAAFAQGNWDKSYTVSTKPSLQVEVDDASVRVRACGGCRTVHIHVDARGGDLSHWQVTEMQGGNGIHFALKHREQRSLFGGGWHDRSPEVTIESPAEADLALRSGDGALQVAGLHGTLDIKTGDGAVQTEETSGPLRIHTGDGAVQVKRAEGTLNATTGNGALVLEGRFSQVDAHTGDGPVQVSLLPGSRLDASSTVTTGDGSIALRVPRDLRADVQVTNGDGAISNNLPLQTSSNDRHSLHGLMNGGGPTLRVRSGDGSIALSSF